MAKLTGVAAIVFRTAGSTAKTFATPKEFLDAPRASTLYSSMKKLNIERQ